MTGMTKSQSSSRVGQTVTYYKQPLTNKKLSSKMELGQRDRNDIVPISISAAFNREDEIVPNCTEEEAEPPKMNTIPNIRLSTNFNIMTIHNDDQPKNTKNLGKLMVNDKRNVSKRQTVLSTDDVVDQLEATDAISSSGYSTKANRASYFSTFYKFAYNMFRDVVKYKFDVEKELPNIQGSMTVLNQKYTGVTHLNDQI